MISLLTLACVSLLCVSCNPEPMSVHDVEGEYNGKLEAEIGGAPAGVVNSAVHTVITSPDNRGLAIAFENLKVVSYNLGSFVVNCGVEYDEKAGAFNLYGEPQVVFAEYGKLPVKVSGAADNGIITLGLDIESLNLKMTYTGFKKNK